MVTPDVTKEQVGCSFGMGAIVIFDTEYVMRFFESQSTTMRIASYFFRLFGKPTTKSIIRSTQGLLGTGRG